MHSELCQQWVHFLCCSVFLWSDKPFYFCFLHKSVIYCMWLWVLPCTKAQQCFRWPSFLCCPFPSTEHTHKNIGWWHGKVSVSFILSVFLFLFCFFLFLIFATTTRVLLKWNDWQREIKDKKAKQNYYYYYFFNVSSGLS